MTRTEIIEHYKSFFGLEDFPFLGENDNLMIAWAQTLLDEVNNNQEEVTGFGLEDLKRGVRVIDQYQEDGKKVVVIGSAANYSAALPMTLDSEAPRGVVIVDDAAPIPRLEDLAHEITPLFNPTFPDINFSKQKRTNHERQPSRFGKKKKRRK